MLASQPITLGQINARRPCRQLVQHTHRDRRMKSSLPCAHAVDASQILIADCPPLQDQRSIVRITGLECIAPGLRLPALVASKCHVNRPFRWALRPLVYVSFPRKAFLAGRQTLYRSGASEAASACSPNVAPLLGATTGLRVPAPWRFGEESLRTASMS